LDKFIQIIEQNDLRPDDIKSVIAIPHPGCQNNFSSKNKLITPDDYSFNEPYLLACAAHGINPARWLDPDVKEDPAIREYMEGLDFTVIIDEEGFATAKRADAETYQEGIEVMAKGKTFKENASHPKGGWFSKELRNTDEELIQKFTDNASRILTFDKASKAARAILALEKFENAAELMEIVAP
jgi:2-methylcitrate dehydratase PrpD